MKPQGKIFHVDIFKITEIGRQLYYIFNRFVIAFSIAFMNGFLCMSENDAVYLGNAKDKPEKAEIKNSFFGLHEADAVVEIAVCGEVEVGDYYVSGAADSD
jgi:hypothetical protein